MCMCVVVCITIFRVFRGLNEGFFRRLYVGFWVFFSRRVYLHMGVFSVKWFKV